MARRTGSPSYKAIKTQTRCRASSNRLSACANIGFHQGLDRDQTPLGNFYPGSSLGRGIHLCDPRTGNLKEMLTTNPSVPIYLHSEPIVTTTGRGCVSPPGLMNANLYGSISLYCMSGHVWPLQPSSLTRGRPPQPPRPLLPRPKPRWRRGAKRLDGADVRCEV